MGELLEVTPKVDCPVPDAELARISAIAHGSHTVKVTVSFNGVAIGSSVSVPVDVIAKWSPWILVHSAWIPSYDATLQAALPTIHGWGQKVQFADTAVGNYKQIFFDCRSTTSAGNVQRVLTHPSATGTTTSLPSTTGFTETVYSADANTGAGTAGVIDLQGTNMAEQHYAFTSTGRFIIRPDQVHCGVNYAVVGGQTDNPALGQWGRVWVRDSTDVPTEAELPGYN